MRAPRIALHAPRCCGSQRARCRSTVPGRSGSANRISPPSMRAMRGRMPMIACATTDLPEPDSPTRATVLPGGTRNDTPSHGLDDAGIHSQIDPEIPNRQHVGHAFPPSAAKRPGSLAGCRSRRLAVQRRTIVVHCRPARLIGDLRAARSGVRPRGGPSAHSDRATRNPTSLPRFVASFFRRFAARRYAGHSSTRRRAARASSSRPTSMRCHRPARPRRTCSSNRRPTPTRCRGCRTDRRHSA